MKKELADLSKATEKMITKTQKQLLIAYKKALNSVRSKLAEVYSKYEKDGVLTYAEMTKYNRLSELQKEINDEIKKLGKVTTSALEKLSSDVYQESYYRTAFAIEKTVGANLKYGLLNPKVIESVVLRKIDKLTLPERLRRHRAEVVYKIREQLTQGLIQGESYKKMSDRIKPIFDGDATKSFRIARTEAHRCQTEGILASCKHADELGVKQVKVWDATLDDKTRDDHREMDGEKVELDEDFVLPDGSTAEGPGMSGEPGQDINCRCRVRIEIVGYEPEFRRIRDEGFVPYKTYNQWAEAKGI